MRSSSTDIAMWHADLRICACRENDQGLAVTDMLVKLYALPQDLPPYAPS